MQSLPKATVGFVYNEPCPLKCSFCCHTKEVVGPGRMTPASIIPVVLKFATHPSIFRYAFTGGDPFVYYKDIVAIMSAARGHGVTQPFHIVTSGYWAKSDKIVDQRLSTLRALGLDVLYVSHDIEHRKWVSSEYVYRIENSCNKYGIAFHVHGIFWDRSTTVQDLLPALKTKNVNTGYVAPIGRAREQPDRIMRDNPDQDKYSCGNPLDYDLTVYPNGDVFPCCSGGFNKEGKFRLGNAYTDSAETIITNCYKNFMVVIAKEIGFHKLFDKVPAAQRRRLGIPEFSEVATVCEICSTIHGDQNIMQALERVLEEMEIAHCVSRFSTIAKALGKSTSLDPGGKNVSSDGSRSKVKDRPELSPAFSG